jgi:hydrogenase maturation factor
MHDPTEGGVLTGLLEMARAAQVGLTVDLDAIPLLSEGAVLCREFGLDPLGTIASGSILLAAPEDAVAALATALDAAGYPTTRIGRATAANCGLVARRGGEPVPWPTYPADEITKLFAG